MKKLLMRILESKTFSFIGIALIFISTLYVVHLQHNTYSEPTLSCSDENPPSPCISAIEKAQKQMDEERKYFEDINVNRTL